MKSTSRFMSLAIILILSTSACRSSATTTTATQTPRVSFTDTSSSTLTAIATPEPSLTPTPVLLDLEILEWYEHAIPNLSDPSSKVTNVEILVHNPNDIPIYMNTDEMEFRFLNAAGEVVYTNSAAYFSLWEGSWMLAGDSTGFQVCYCFESSGLVKQELASIELIAPIQPATDVVYTTDVEAILGEPFDIAKAHLGGSGTGIPITMTNTSDQPLGSIPMRVIARDASGRYIGMPGFGNSVVSFTENIGIQPGDSLYGSMVSEIDYFDGPLTYEVVAIGIPFQAAEATAEAALPSGTPLADWNGIPIMPGALAGEAVDTSGYQYTTSADLAEIAAFYETELTNLGYEVELAMDQTVGQAILNFSKGDMTGMVAIVPLGGGLNGVALIINQ